MRGTVLICLWVSITHLQKCSLRLRLCSTLAVHGETCDAVWVPRSLWNTGRPLGHRCLSPDQPQPFTNESSYYAKIGWQDRN